ncbi:Putative Exosome-associated protein [Aspergillus calidoustus]|uniref:Exosome complex protein n=1 Tax=Aspergillus calidoustus TaxID=454130 RepID=A0A0U5GDG5_ASPCI|nr:Putative Exosome-associated protein [Aspergillus calidoustus]
METAALLPLLEQLDDNVDELEEVLAPILRSTVVETSKKLPVLDKAKFHVMITYALESLIFSYLRLHGVNAKEHPVFRELTRVKQYFEKIKTLETPPEQRTMVLDKQAASRFIKHGLAGNDKLDLQREEQLAKEKARTQLKASLLAKKAKATPETTSKNISSGSNSDFNPNVDSDDDVVDDAVLQDPESSEIATGSQKKAKKKKAKSGAQEAKHKKRSKEDRRERHKERRKKKEESRKART